MTELEDKQAEEALQAWRRLAPREVIEPGEFARLREACLDKFGEEEGLEKFKKWMHGKWIKLGPEVHVVHYYT